MQLVVFVNFMLQSHRFKKNLMLKVWYEIKVCYSLLLLIKNHIHIYYKIIIIATCSICKFQFHKFTKNLILDIKLKHVYLFLIIYFSC